MPDIRHNLLYNIGRTADPIKHSHGYQFIGKIRSWKVFTSRISGIIYFTIQRKLLILLNIVRILVNRANQKLESLHIPDIRHNLLTISVNLLFLLNIIRIMAFRVKQNPDDTQVSDIRHCYSTIQVNLLFLSNIIRIMVFRVKQKPDDRDIRYCLLYIIGEFAVFVEHSPDSDIQDNEEGGESLHNGYPAYFAYFIYWITGEMKLLYSILLLFVSNQIPASRVKQNPDDTQLPDI